MATLFRRDNGVFYLKLRDSAGKEIRQSCETKNKREALRIKAAVEQQMAEVQVTGRPVEEIGWDEGWKVYEEALGPHKKDKTLYNEGLVWKAWAAWCEQQGIMTMQSVRVVDVARWQSGMAAEQRSAHGINTYLRTIKQVWNHLLRLETVTCPNPFDRVKPLPAEVQVKFLPWEAVQRLVGCAEQVGRDIHLVFVLGAYGGLRKDEILRARWEHVEWDQGRLLVDGTKTAASRDYVPLHNTLRVSLEPYREAEGWIVRPDKQDSGKLCAYRWAWQKQWKQVEKLACVTVSPHQLRHSVATHLLDIGYPLQQVAVFLRHASDIPTRKYANLKGVRLEIDHF